ncbi:hypothetical protein T4A_7230 [Trichinella pseudospiralis]|uniref:Uncharacterized protein n=1 Tax=Trichinella pseudospiralis TaxID=6337 RepID=A0A0V1EQJ5_TRIPS|nr:hypothetical protein T4A_7230 [Trichinella pseudospiralis]
MLMNISIINISNLHAVYKLCRMPVAVDVHFLLIFKNSSKINYSSCLSVLVIRRFQCLIATASKICGRTFKRHGAN